MEKKYGVKIPWPDTGYTWVTECGPSFNTKPILFDSLQSAQKFAEYWGVKALAVEYNENQNT